MTPRDDKKSAKKNNLQRTRGTTHVQNNLRTTCILNVSIYMHVLHTNNMYTN